LAQLAGKISGFATVDKFGSCTETLSALGSDYTMFVVQRVLCQFQGIVFHNNSREKGVYFKIFGV
jgi:hypothetical protein